jgi:hypothetical protein
MKLRKLLIALILAAVAAPVVAWENPQGYEFTATAIMETRDGTRRMPVTLIARRVTSVEEAQRLEEVLANGGQGALLSALRGSQNGLFRMGALEFPVNLVAAEETRDGYELVFVTSRRIQVEEREFSSESLDYPFGVAVFEVRDFGTGEGTIYPQAAIRVDPDEETVVVEQYDGEPGRLVDVKKVR